MTPEHRPPGCSSTRQDSSCNNRIPIRRALVSVYDKTGLEDLARGAARRRRRAGLDRRLGRADRGARAAGDQGRGADRLPRVPRRPGQDAAPARARRHPRRPPPRLPRRAARRARHRAVRPGRVQPLPVHRRPSRRARPPTSASSRSTSAARRWCAPPPRTTRRSRSSPRPRGTPTCSRAVAAGGFTLDRAASGWPPRRSPTPRRTTWRWRTGWRRSSRPSRGPAGPTSPARRWERAAVLRYGENPHQAAALYPRRRRGGLADAEQLHGKEMSYNNYVDTDAAPARGVRLRRARPSRSSSTPTRAASPSAPTWPRRTARRTRATRSRRSAA